MGWGLEIDGDALRLCRAEMRRGRLRIHRRVEVAVPAGLIQPSLKEPNVRDAAALRALLQDLSRKSGYRGWVRVALPDPVFSLRTIATDDLPERREEARRFLRWQARDLLPFPPEEARLDFLPQGRGPDGRLRTVCLMARDRILREYEQPLADSDLRAAVVDARSISLAQAASARLGRRSAALLTVGKAWTTLLWVDEGRPRFRRVLPEGQPAWAGPDRARLLREIATSIAFCQESEGGGALDELMVAGLNSVTGEVMSVLETWLQIPVSPLEASGQPGEGTDPAGLADDFMIWGAAVGAAIRPACAGHADRPC